ncbi:MAG: sulfite exporter TauE/SafE family protein [Dehalococcoidia bacterium]|nr:sulfite exporter TauE/SafE family protein [Dehalococcoidia bacterium]
MSLLEVLGLVAAAFAAGAVNALAGGGSLISFPALVAAGYPAKTANVTNTVALWPGYVGGSFGYRELLVPQRRTIALLAGSSIAGAVAGSAILLSTPESAFEAIVPFLILFAALLLAVQTRIAAFVAAHRRPRPPSEAPLELHAAVFVLAVYGAYFGAGLGILTLAVLGIVLPDDLQRSNALKGVLSLLINAVAVVYFAAFGPVEWPPALVMALAALTGGYAGAHLARQLSPRLLRTAVVVFSVVAALVLLVR